MRKDVRKEDDLQIPFRVREGFRADGVTAAPAEHRVEVEKDERRQDEKEQEFERDELAEQFFARGTIAFAQFDGKCGGMSRADEDAERPEKEHNREAKRQARHRRLATTLTNVKAIDDSIKRVQAHRHKRRPRIL